MKSFARADRVSALIQEVVAQTLRKDITDPRIQSATITGVKMSRDLRIARIYFAVPGGTEKVERALEGFNRAMGYMKKKLAGELELRFMPQLHFHYDESIDYGARIDAVLKTITEHEKDNPAVGTE
jgi:ribosome-binding factor A